MYITYEPWRQDADVSCDEEVRHLFAQLISSPSPQDIAIAPSTAFAMTLAATNLISKGIIREGLSILVLENEMASNVYPWQHACNKTGARLSVVTHPKDTDTWSRKIIAALVGDDTICVLAISNVHWCDGSMIDLIEVSRFIHTMVKPPFLVVDGTQSIGVVPFSVTDIQPDFVACSVHKWLLGPHGASLMYLHHKHTWEPLDMHERSRLGSDTVFWDSVGTMHSVSRGEQRPHGVYSCGTEGDMLSKQNGSNIAVYCRDDKLGYPVAFVSGARRISAGGRPNPIVMPMLKESLKLILSWTPFCIEEYLRKLTDALATWIEQKCKGFLVNHRAIRSAHIIGIQVDSQLLCVSPAEVIKTLLAAGVHTVLRHGSIRISPYMYNNEEDMMLLGNLFQKMSVESIAICRTRPVRILITGGTGWLAQFLTKNFLDNYSDSSVELHVTSRHPKEVFWLPQNRVHHLDLCAPYSIQSVISTVLPDIVIHAAAMSSPAACESSPLLSDAINCPLALIDAIKQFVPRCKVVFTSTDLVYDGNSNNLHEPLHPESIEITPSMMYGKSKLKFEKEVLLLPFGLVLRLSNMVGPNFAFAKPNGTKFLQWIQNNVEHRVCITLKNDEIRSFVSVYDVIKVISAVVGDDVHHKFEESDNSALVCKIFDQKVYNIGGPQPLSRLDFANIVSGSMNVSMKLVDVASELPIQGESSWLVKSVSCSEMQQLTNGSSLDAISPRNVAMNSVLTERHFSKFVRIEELLLNLAKASDPHSLI